MGSYSLIYGARRLVRSLRGAEDDPAPLSLNAKLAMLRRNAASLRNLAAEVTSEIEAQAKAAEIAAAEANRNEQLAKLSAEQARAVNEVFDAAGLKQQRALTKSTVVWALISIFVSNIVSVVVALTVAGVLG